MSCVVAVELEASPEAIRPNPEGVGDLHIPAVGRAVSQGGIGRDLHESVPSGSMGMDHGRRSRHSDQAGERNTNAN